jgi:NADH-quinone oxidoreductase subunit G
MPWNSPRPPDQIRETSKGAAAIGGLASPHQTVEELYLFTKLLRGLGTENIDHRPAQADGYARAGARWLGMPVADLNTLERVLLIGATLRQEQPLIAQRLRQAVKHGAQLNVVHAADDDLLCKVAGKLIVKPSALVNGLARIAKALQRCRRDCLRHPMLTSGGRRRSARHRRQSHVRRAQGRVARCAWPRTTRLPMKSTPWPRPSRPSPARPWASCPPPPIRSAARSRVPCPDPTAWPPPPCWASQGLRPLPPMCCSAWSRSWKPATAPRPLAALKGADFVVQMSAFKTAGAWATPMCCCPSRRSRKLAAPSSIWKAACKVFHGAVKPQGEARPAWKVLRVLGNLLSLGGFDYASVEARPRRCAAARTGRHRRPSEQCRYRSGTGPSAKRGRTGTPGRDPHQPARCAYPPVRAPTGYGRCRRALRLDAWRSVGRPEPESGRCRAHPPERA